MINPKDFTEFLIENDLDFFAGVPDSFLKDFLAEIPLKNNHLFPNEGSAIAAAIGHYLACDKPALIYMQNSGLGNAINPLISSAHNGVYGISMILFIGWRGEAGIHDEPQHLVQGENLLPMLASMKIPYGLLSFNIDRAKVQIKEALQNIKQTPGPVAFIIHKDLFEKKSPTPKNNKFKVNRQSVIQNLHEICPEAIYVATTGHTARELYQVRVELELGHDHCFYNTGAMGHASQIANSLAKENPNRKIILLEGDGSMAMHLGNYLTVANNHLDNLKIICFNNESHLSVGGQSSSWLDVDITKVISSMGITTLKPLSSNRSLKKKLSDLIDGTAKFLEVKASNVPATNLPRPKESHPELKKLLMDQLNAN